jgi:hypothetical protein
MLDTYTMDTFKPRIGEIFRIIVDDQWQLPVALTSVDPWGPEAGKGRDRAPFSLIFHGASDSFLPQRMYQIENEKMEPMELFLVPIGPDERGMRYEAVFT